MRLPRQLRGSIGVGLGFDFREKGRQGPKGEFGGSLIQTRKRASPKRGKFREEFSLGDN